MLMWMVLVGSVSSGWGGGVSWLRFRIPNTDPDPSVKITR
jgi:hypothetical protein